MQNGPFHIRRAGSSSLNCWYTTVVLTDASPNTCYSHWISTPCRTTLMAKLCAWNYAGARACRSRSIPLHQFPGPLLGYREGAHRSQWYVQPRSHAAQPALSRQAGAAAACHPSPSRYWSCDWGIRCPRAAGLAVHWCGFPNAITHALVGSHVHCSCRTRYLNEYVSMRHQC